MNERVDQLLVISKSRLASSAKATATSVTGNRNFPARIVRTKKFEKKKMARCMFDSFEAGRWLQQRDFHRISLFFFFVFILRVLAAVQWRLHRRCVMAITAPARRTRIAIDCCSCSCGAWCTHHLKKSKVQALIISTKRVNFD